jgi:hypothetical protein
VKISNNFFSFFPSLNQYFPHIPYVASIYEKNVLGCFMAEKHDLKDKKMSRAVAVRKICTSPTGSALSARKLKFWLLLGQLDAPRPQNFEIQVPKGSHLREVFAVLLFRP